MWYLFLFQNTVYHRWRDFELLYDCPYSLKTYLLIIKNTLHVASMDHNLIPPFIMKKAGLEVRSTAKIHSNDLCVSDHSIYDSETGLQIPLKLRGIFSYLKTRSITDDEILNSQEYPTVYLTSDSSGCNPHSTH